MIQDHLHILHLNNTGDDKVDRICNERYGNLMEELINQNITNYTIWDGYYDPKNTKQAIHLGHRRIVQYAKDNNLESILICEDDIKFTSPNSFRYFLDNTPKSYDLYFALIYSGTIENNRVMNGFSAGMSLYRIHNRFYNEFLEMPIDSHVDRQAGLVCYNHEFIVVDKYCVEQRGGYSHNLRRSMTYQVYLEGKELCDK